MVFSEERGNNDKDLRLYISSAGLIKPVTGLEYRSMLCRVAHEEGRQSRLQPGEQNLL